MFHASHSSQPPKTSETFKAIFGQIATSQKFRCCNSHYLKKESLLDFELSNYNLGDHRIQVSPANGTVKELRQVIRVPAKPLDSFDIVRSDKPLAVKIDTQGAEPFVIAGGRKTLARAQLIVLEWCPFMIAKMGSDPLVVLEFLRSSFGLGRISQAEASAEAGQFMTIDQTCDLLFHTIAAEMNNEKYYVDIIAMK